MIHGLPSNGFVLCLLCWLLSLLIARQVISHAQQLNVNSESISIGGLSAGGQMSAVMAHFARDEGINLKLQLLIVGAFDFQQVPPTGSDIEREVPYESFVTYKDVPWGPLGRLQWFVDQWIGTDEGTCAYARLPGFDLANLM